MSTFNDTCVYTHTRSDGVVFYVGIGDAKRPYSERDRNQHWHHTTSKYAYTIVVVHTDLSWDAAAAIEVQLIAKYREISGDKLCNMTLGGDGAKGYRHTAEAKAAIGAFSVGNKHNLGRTASAEHRAKIGAASLGHTLSAESKLKISIANTGKATMLGKHHSDDAKDRIRVANLGKKLSEATKAKVSIAARNRKPISEETRLKMRLAHQKQSAFLIS